MRWDTMPTATWHSPSSFKTGRHSQWWLSMLHLMHSWAQLHRQSLFGICAGKSRSYWMNLSSGWPTTVLLQILLCPYQLTVDCCNLFSCNGAVVLWVCWHVTIIMAITVIVIFKVALTFCTHLMAQQHWSLRWVSCWTFALVWQRRLKSAVAQGLYRRSTTRSDINCA